MPLLSRFALLAALVWPAAATDVQQRAPGDYVPVGPQYRIQTTLANGTNRYLTAQSYDATNYRPGMNLSDGTVFTYDTAYRYLFLDTQAYGGISDVASYFVPAFRTTSSSTHGANIYSISENTAFNAAATRANNAGFGNWPLTCSAGASAQDGSSGTTSTTLDCAQPDAGTGFSFFAFCPVSNTNRNLVLFIYDSAYAFDSTRCTAVTAIRGILVDSPASTSTAAATTSSPTGGESCSVTVQLYKTYITTYATTGTGGTRTAYASSSAYLSSFGCSPATTTFTFSSVVGAAAATP